MVKRAERVALVLILRTLTSQDLLCGSNKPEKASFLEAEKDFDLVNFSAVEGILKRDLMAEEVEGRREEGGEDWGSRVERRSKRQEGQKPEKLSSGWRSQVKEDRWGCGGGGSGSVAVVVVGFISGIGGGGGGVQCALRAC